MLVAGIIIAMARRLFSKGKDVQARNADVDWILIIGLLIVVVTGFYAQGIREAADVERAVIPGYEARRSNGIL